MNKTTKLLTKILEDDNLTKKFINENNEYLLNNMEKVMFVKLTKMDNDSPKIKYLDVVYRIICIYNKFYLVLFKKRDKIFENKNLKMLKEYYKYLKLREEMFGKNINSKEQEISDLIESFFKNIEYYESAKIILNEYDKFILDKKKLTNEEYKLFNKILLNNCFDNLPDSYINYYLYLVLNNDYKINLGSLKIVILNLGINILKKYNINCKIVFKNMEADGLFYKNIIYINNNLVSQFVDSKCKDLTIFVTLFHEIQHAIQDKNIKSNNYSNYIAIKMIKDILFIDFMSKKEYNMNYYRFTTEIDAYNMEFIWTYRFFKKIGVRQKFIGLEKMSIIKYNMLYKTDNRIINHKLLPLDILFDIYMKDIIIFYRNKCNVNIFELYPLLKYIYNLDGTRKDTVQLFKECDSADESKKWIYYDIINKIKLYFLFIFPP